MSFFWIIYIVSDVDSENLVLVCGDCNELHKFNEEKNCLLPNDKDHMTNIIYQYSYFCIIMLAYKYIGNIILNEKQ